MPADLTTLSDEHLKAIADGRLDTLPDEVLQKISGDTPQTPAVPAAQLAPEIPRPDTKTGPTFNMDPFARTGYLMNTQQGQQAMAQVGQTVKNMGLEGGGAALGQAIGAPFEAVGGMHIGGAAGGGIGNAAAQLTTPGKDFKIGEVLAAMAAGAVPGASLAKAGIGQVAKQGAKYAAANLAGKTIQTGVDEGRLPTVGEAALAAGSGAIGAPISKFLDSGTRVAIAEANASRDAVRRETLNAGRELGLVVPPSAVNPNIVNDSLQSLAGKAATAQEAILRNQPKVNAAVRAEIGLPESAPLSPIALNTQKVGPNMVYGQIAQSGPAAAGLLDKFKSAMDQARELRSAYRASLDAGLPNNATLAAARAAETQADVFKQGLKKVVAPALYDSFDQARTQLAKIGMVERGVRLGDGNVDAKVFGDALESGEKLTGNLLKLGKFQSAFGRYIKEASATQPSGVDYLKMASKGGLAVGGLMKGDPTLAIAGPAALYAAERGARSGILSPVGQRLLANPFYGPELEDAGAGVSRLAAESAGRNPASVNLDEPLSDEEMKRYQELKAKLGR